MPEKIVKVKGLFFKIKSIYDLPKKSIGPCAVCYWYKQCRGPLGKTMPENWFCSDIPEVINNNDVYLELYPLGLLLQEIKE